MSGSSSSTLLGDEASKYKIATNNTFIIETNNHYHDGSPYSSNQQKPVAMTAYPENGIKKNGAHAMTRYQPYRHPATPNNSNLYQLLQQSPATPSHNRQQLQHSPVSCSTTQLNLQQTAANFNAISSSLTTKNMGGNESDQRQFAAPFFEQHRQSFCSSQQQQQTSSFIPNIGGFSLPQQQQHPSTIPTVNSTTMAAMIQARQRQMDFNAYEPSSSFSSPISNGGNYPFNTNVTSNFTSGSDMFEPISGSTPFNSLGNVLLRNGGIASADQGYSKPNGRSEIAAVGGNSTAFAIAPSPMFYANGMVNGGGYLYSPAALTMMNNFYGGGTTTTNYGAAPSPSPSSESTTMPEMMLIKKWRKAAAAANYNNNNNDDVNSSSQVILGGIKNEPFPLTAVSHFPFSATDGGISLSQLAPHFLLQRQHQYDDDAENPPHPCGPGTNNYRVRTTNKYRTVYNEQQRFELEQEFCTNQFINGERKTHLSSALKLTERQIKIWFQNRRAKQRRQQGKGRSKKQRAAA